MLRAMLIATSLAVATPCFAQQVRVINGDFEHVYGPGGQLLDNADLQARNQRAREHLQAEQQLAIERRQAEIEAERLRLQEAALAYAPSVDTSYGGGWDGGGFIGSTGGFRRGVIRPRIGMIKHGIGGAHGMGGFRR